MKQKNEEIRIQLRQKNLDDSRFKETQQGKPEDSRFKRNKSIIKTVTNLNRLIGKYH